MDTFEYRNGQLCCEEVALTRIAEEFGTPTYVYSRDALERAYALRDGGMVLMYSDPLLRPLYNEPRFLTSAENMKFT